MAAFGRIRPEPQESGRQIDRSGRSERGMVPLFYREYDPFLRGHTVQLDEVLSGVVHRCVLEPLSDAQSRGREDGGGMDKIIRGDFERCTGTFAREDVGEGFDQEWLSGVEV